MHALTTREPNRADAIVSVNAQSIPLFQFGVFYEGDLEIHNGPPMTFAGWVHTNSNLYLSSDNTFFQDLITTPGSVYWDRKAYSDRLNGVWINNAGAVPVNLTFDSRSKPVPNDFRAASQASFDGRLMTSAHGVTPLRLPLPPGMPAVELVRPRSAGDDPDARKVKEAWLADLYVTVDLNQLAALCVGPGALQYLARPNGRQTPDALACPLIFNGKPERVPGGPGGHRRGHARHRRRRAGELDRGQPARPARGHPVHHVHQRQRGRGHRGLPGRAPDQRERAAVPADDRHRSAGLRAGRLQQRRLEARRAAERRRDVPLRRMERRRACRLPGRPDDVERRDVGVRGHRGGAFGDAVRLSGRRLPGRALWRRPGKLPALPRALERHPDALPRLAGLAVREPGGQPPRVELALLLRSAGA